MSMRYLIKRAKPEDFSEVKKGAPSLEKQLGDAAEHLRRYIEVDITPGQYAVYQFVTRKTNEKWGWICPSLELVAESEKAFFALTDRFEVPRSALSHIPKS